MSEAKAPLVYVSMPAAPCAECVAKDHYVVNGEFAVVWCPHLRYGALYEIDNAQWHISGPYHADDDFKRVLANFFRPRAPIQH